MWWSDKRAALEKSTATVVVSDNQLESFLAFVATYVSTYVPFTAFFRVIAADRFRAFHSLAREKVNPLPSELVGLTIAEAALQIGERFRSPADLSIQACNATLSSAALQALSIGYSVEIIPTLTKNWARAHRALGGEHLRIPVEVISDFWITLAAAITSNLRASDKPRDPVRFLNSFMTKRELTSEDWHQVTSDIPDLRGALQQMRGSREDRIRSFDQYTRMLFASSHVDRRTREIAAGALMSLVAQGSLHYLPLSQAFQSALPASNLWFAFFASLHPSSDVFSVADCLGRRLARKLPRSSWVDRMPEVDISVDELEVLAGARGAEIRFRTEHANQINVELVPGATARFRLHKSGPNDADTSARYVSSDLREVRMLLHRVGRLLDRAQGVELPDQADLFPVKGTRLKGPKTRPDR
ncbi:MAG: hypothetical protein Q8R02_08370 [Hyphomonadaceae bacterium]|nr:hypothetical protein [Hyphomonadaceae bacterium]